MSDSLDLLEAIVESQKEFVGEQQALSAARESTVQVGADGDIQDFYGEETVAVEILLQRFYERTGEPGLRYTRRYLRKQDMKMPEDVEMPERGPGIIQKVIKSIKNIAKV